MTPQHSCTVTHLCPTACSLLPRRSMTSLNTLSLSRPHWLFSLLLPHCFRTQYFQVACVNQFMSLPGLSMPDTLMYRNHSSNDPFLCSLTFVSPVLKGRAFNSLMTGVKTMAQRQCLTPLECQSIHFPISVFCLTPEACTTRR